MANLIQTKQSKLPFRTLLLIIMKRISINANFYCLLDELDVVIVIYSNTYIHILHLKAT